MNCSLLRYLLIICLLMPACFSSIFFTAPALATDIPPGSVSGVWAPAGNPYLIQGDLLVSLGDQLLIEPGTEVSFQGSFQLTVAGLLLANGTVTDSIFIAGIVPWSGIRLENETTTSTMTYCHIDGAETAINSINSPLTVSNCVLSNNGKGLNIFGVGSSDPAEVLIEYTRICHSQQNGIFIVENSNAVIDHCDISSSALDGSPRAAIQLSNQSAGIGNSPSITSNWIHHNTWQGITAFDLTGAGNCYPTITGNQIEYNLTGVYLLHANGFVRDNRITNNFEDGNTDSGAGVMVGGASASPLFTGNTISGNYTGFYFVNGASANLGNLTNDDPADDGGNFIFDNIDPGGNTWTVYSMSSADISAENNYWGSEDYAAIALTINDGNDNPAYGIVDFDPILPVAAVEPGADDPSMIDQIMFSSYPNPFVSTNHIKFALNDFHATSPVRLSIYDAAGRLVRTLINGTVSPGHQSQSWDGTDEAGQVVNSGLYYCRLTIADTTRQKSILLVR